MNDFELAQVGVVQFASSPIVDLQLTKHRDISCRSSSAAIWATMARAVLLGARILGTIALETAAAAIRI